ERDLGGCSVGRSGQRRIGRRGKRGWRRSGSCRTADDEQNGCKRAKSKPAGETSLNSDLQGKEFQRGRAQRVPILAQARIKSKNAPRPKGFWNARDTNRLCAVNPSGLAAMRYIPNLSAAR